MSSVPRARAGDTTWPGKTCNRRSPDSRGSRWPEGVACRWSRMPSPARRSRSHPQSPAHLRHSHPPTPARRRQSPRVAHERRARRGPVAFDIRATSGELPVTSLVEAERELERLVRAGYRVVVAFEQRAEAERAGYILKRAPGRVAGQGDVPVTAGLSFYTVPHRRHFVMPEIKLALLCDTQVFPRRRKAIGERRLVIGAELSSFRDLRKGDYVVHEDHGIGRFEGISTKTVAGVTRDYLDIAFRDGDMLYIPHDQIGKVSRYVGAEAGAPALSKLGGRAWDQVKSRARRGGARVGRRVAAALRHAPDHRGIPVLGGRRLAAALRRRLPLPGDRGPAAGHRRRQGRHGIRLAHGPSHLRGRGLRQDRGGAAGHVQGGHGLQTGHGPGSHHHPGAAALRHLPGTVRRLSRSRWR